LVRPLLAAGFRARVEIVRLRRSVVAVVVADRERANESG
jgi:hypothetical protein